MWKARSGGQKFAVGGGGEQLFPSLVAEPLDRMHDLNAGVADQHIDATKCRDYRGDAVVDCLLAADVHRDSERLAACGPDLARRRVGGALVEICDRDLGPFPRVRERDLLADAARCAGDDRRLVLELHGYSPDRAPGAM